MPLDNEHPPKFHTRGRYLFGFLLCLAITLILSGDYLFKSTTAQAYEATKNSSILVYSQEASNFFLPWVSSERASNANPLLCRFGVNAPSGVGNYPVGELRVGWYQNYATSTNPDRPQGMEFAQTIRLSQTSANTYSYRPSASILTQAAILNPGAIWYIGNEPDRKFYQDSMEPHLYARAYYDLYHLIKETDPTARIFAGSIVQPTLIRLLYLDKVLDAYRQTYGYAMPVDGWSIHNFILNEASCDVFPGDCWGADIPPGVNRSEGLRVDAQDNDNFGIFVEQIQRFRQWMWNRGYQNTPLFLSEYGVLMPQGRGFKPDFTPERVNLFMEKTFDYLLTATDSQYGYPPDGNRLVQRLSWFSTDYPEFNGQLFDSQSRDFTEIGRFYKNYTQSIQETVDFYPIKISTEPASLISTGEPITVTLIVQIANSGNGLAAQRVQVRFYDKDPSQGGAQIGETQSVMLSGCGDVDHASVQWTSLSQGVHTAYVIVSGDPNSLMEEGNALANNQLHQDIMIGTDQLFLPKVNR
ncbi:MAG: hypothetical protein KF893_02750 [Caldilineaceae bacterium]|nr:hypothetical protein [Caldilineaceae bacterium]